MLLNVSNLANVEFQILRTPPNNFCSRETNLLLYGARLKAEWVFGPRTKALKRQNFNPYLEPPEWRGGNTAIHPHVPRRSSSTNSSGSPFVQRALVLLRISGLFFYRCFFLVLLNSVYVLCLVTLNHILIGYGNWGWNNNRQLGLLFIERTYLNLLNYAWSDGFCVFQLILVP